MDKRKYTNLQDLTYFKLKAIRKFSKQLFPITSWLFTLFGIFLNVPRLQNIYPNLNIQGEVDIFTVTTPKVNLFSYVYNVKFRSCIFPFMKHQWQLGAVMQGGGRGLRVFSASSNTLITALQGKNPRQDKPGPALMQTLLTGLKVRNYYNFSRIYYLAL